MSNRWTVQELDLLAEKWPRMGERCADLFPLHPARSVTATAHRLGLKRLTAADLILVEMEADEEGLTLDDMRERTGVNVETLKKAIQLLLKKRRIEVDEIEDARRTGGRRVRYVAISPDDEGRTAEREPVPAPPDMLECAMRSRTPLELAWVGAA